MNADPLFGVEEEFFVVDAEGAPLPRNIEIVDAADLGDALTVELAPNQIETNSAVCRDLAAVREQVVWLRTRTATAARHVGGRLLAAGVPPLGPPAVKVTAKARYRQMVEEFGRLVTEQQICGCHVHVDVDDPDTAVFVGNHLRPWLPILLGLTANSAVHSGADTGFASWRTIAASRWPCSGPPPFFGSAARFHDEVAMLIDAGAILDRAMIYWDARPSAHLPTIEVRVSDVPATADETVLLAALIRALVAKATLAVRSG